MSEHQHEWKIVMGFRQLGNTLEYEYVVKCKTCGHLEELKPEMVEHIFREGGVSEDRSA